MEPCNHSTVPYEFFIDPSRCIGCQACVQACGELDFGATARRHGGRIVRPTLQHPSAGTHWRNASATIEPSP
ncbi:MAG: hypothetical protein FJ403_22840, partial [Verrucomicrobia bacterium]|nr:hypothetical protein [Verrucomicrobiota bacterium]